MTQPNSKLGITLSIFGVVFAGLSAMAAVLALRTPEPTVIMIPQPQAETDKSQPPPTAEPSGSAPEQAETDKARDVAAEGPNPRPVMPEVSLTSPVTGTATLVPTPPVQAILPEPEQRLSPVTDPVPEEIRVFESKSARVCADRHLLRFTVRKNGTAAGDAIYLKQGSQTRLVTIGDSLKLAEDCRIVLQNTGKTSDYFAEFLLFLET